MKPVMLAITRCPARAERTYTLQSSAYRTKRCRRAFELAVKRVQHDVRQEWRQRPPLRSALLRRTEQPVLQHPRIQERAGELQHACIRHALSQPTHQEVMIHSVEEFFEVEVHDPPIAARQVFLRRRYRLMCRPTRPKPIAVVGERRVEESAAAPAAPLAGRNGRERWARPVCARHHPVWESRRASTGDGV